MNRTVHIVPFGDADLMWIAQQHQQRIPVIWAGPAKVRPVSTAEDRLLLCGVMDTVLREIRGGTFRPAEHPEIGVNTSTRTLDVVDGPALTPHVWLAIAFDHRCDADKMAQELAAYRETTLQEKNQNA